MSTARDPLADFFRARVQVSAGRLLGPAAALDRVRDARPAGRARPARRGPDAAVGASHRVGRVAVSRLLVQLHARPAARPGAAGRLAAVVWRIVRALTGGIAAVLAYLLVRREATDDRWALAAWAGVTAAMAWPLTAGPNASATALAFGSLLAARRHGARAGALAGLAVPVPARDRRWRPRSAPGCWAAGGGGRRSWWPRPSRSSACCRSWWSHPVTCSRRPSASPASSTCSGCRSPWRRTRPTSTSCSSGCSRRSSSPPPRCGR